MPCLKNIAQWWPTHFLESFNDILRAESFKTGRILSTRELQQKKYSCATRGKLLQNKFFVWKIFWEHSLQVTTHFCVGKDHVKNFYIHAPYTPEWIKLGNFQVIRFTQVTSF
jgi:hypothetical protein